MAKEAVEIDVEISFQLRFVLGLERPLLGWKKCAERVEHQVELEPFAAKPGAFAFPISERAQVLEHLDRRVEGARAALFLGCFLHVVGKRRDDGDAQLCPQLGNALVAWLLADAQVRARHHACARADSFAQEPLVVPGFIFGMHRP